MSILEPFSVYPTVNLTKGVTEMKGRIKYLSLAVVLCLTRCGNEEKKPEGLLNKQEMVALMVEVYLAEAKISVNNISRDSAAKLFGPFEESILAERGMVDSTLKANYSYYLQKPVELESILDAVIDTLNLREQRTTDQP